MGRLGMLELRHKTLAIDFGALEQDANAFRSGLSDTQSELLNRVNTLKTDTSRQTFFESISLEQRGRLKGLFRRKANLEAQRTQLLEEISNLQRDAMHIQNLETRVAERNAFSDRLFAVGLALTQAGQQQQQQMLLQQQQHLQWQQNLELQRTNCLLRAMQSRVPIICP